MDALSEMILSHPFWIWLAVGALFLAIEVTTGSGWLLWPAGSAALVAFGLLVLPLNAAGQLAVFALFTIISTYVGRRFIRGRAKAGPDVNDPLVRLIGHRGEAAAAFVNGGGRVFVDGKEWSAELEGEEAVAAGAKLEVIAVLGGARLKVRPA